MTRQLFETTFYSEDQHEALAVVSVPIEYVPDGKLLASSPANLLSALRLRPVAEVPRDYLSDAVTALLVSTTAEEAAEWLATEPNPAPVGLGDDVKALDEERIRAEMRRDALLSIEEPLPPKSRAQKRAGKDRRKPTKDKARLEFGEFARDVAGGAVVPFQQSPVDLFPLTDLVDAADAVRSFIATVRTNPILLVWLGGTGAGATGFLLWSAIRGTGRGLSAGLQYRLLKLFGVPDDIIRDQMRQRQQ